MNPQTTTDKDSLSTRAAGDIARCPKDEFRPEPIPILPQGLADKRNDVRNLAAGAGIALSGRAIGRATRLATDVVLAHTLGPASFGLYAIGWTITRLATLVSPMGLDAGVIRFGSESWRVDSARVKSTVRQSLLYSSLSGLWWGGVLYALAPWLGARVFHQPRLISVFHWFALAFPLITSLRVASAATRISQRMKFSVYAEEIVQPGLALFLVLAFGLVGWKLGGALAAITFSFGVSLVVALGYVNQLFPEALSVARAVSVNAGKELFLFSLPAAASLVLGMLLVWVDRLFVGYYRTAAEAGIYHAASQLSIALAAILSSFSLMITPMAAHLYHQGKLQRLEELFRVSTKWSLYLSIPPFLLMCFVPQEIMAALFGRAFAAGGGILPILGAGQLINSGTGAASALLIMSGNQNKIATITGIALLGNIAWAVLFVPRWGMLGAAWGTGWAVAGLSVVSLFVTRVFVGVWPYDRRYWKGLLAGGIAGGALLLVRRFPAFSTPYGLALLAGVVFFVFLFALLSFGLDGEDREFINLFLERMGVRREGVVAPGGSL